eukprot:scaffold23319_cov124-Skeletonema_marinoi.AAC.1
MRTIHLVLQRTPTPFKDFWLSNPFVWKLSSQSPDRYDEADSYYNGHECIFAPSPPFNLQIVQAGSRLGWSWWSEDDSCETNWLDPEPSSESDDFETYIEELQRIQQRLEMDFYIGYNEPPNQQQYRRLCEDYIESY